MKELIAFDIIDIKVCDEPKFCLKIQSEGFNGASMLKGILAVVAASVAYGFLPVFSKIALGTGLSSSAVVFWRFMMACLVVAVIMRVKKMSFRVTRVQLVHLCFFGLLGSGITSLLLTVSYEHIPIGLATMFHFSYPLFVTIIMIIMYKEKATPFKCISMAAALGGLILMADFSGGMSLQGVLFAALSGLTYAIYVIATRKSAFALLPIFTTMFYVTLISSLYFGVQLLVTGSFMVPGSVTAWGAIASVAMLCTVFALCLLMRGIQLLGPVTASVLNMIEPVTSVIAGIFIFHDKLSVKAFAGCSLIVLSALLISLDARRSATRAEEPEPQTVPAAPEGGEQI